MPISINVNVKKLDKERFVAGQKSGGLYANITLWETEPGTEAAEYGDYIVKQTGEAGDKMPILGNGKFFEPKSRGGRGQSRGGRSGGYRGRESGGRRRDDDRGYDQRRRGGEPPGRSEDEIPF